MLHPQEFLLGTLYLRGCALGQWWASTALMWISPIGQRRTCRRYGRWVNSLCFDCWLSLGNHYMQANHVFISGVPQQRARVLHCDDG